MPSLAKLPRRAATQKYFLRTLSTLTQHGWLACWPRVQGQYRILGFGVLAAVAKAGRMGGYEVSCEPTSGSKV